MPFHVVGRFCTVVAKRSNALGLTCGGRTSIASNQLARQRPPSGPALLGSVPGPAGHSLAVACPKSRQHQNGNADHDSHVCDVKDAGSYRSDSNVHEINDASPSDAVHPIRRTASENEAHADQLPPLPAKAHG